MPNPAIPPLPAALAKSKGPELDLPASPAFNRVYMLWSADHFQPIVNGVATFRIDSIINLQNAMEFFPSRRTVGLLRRAGIRTVFLHLDMFRFDIPRKWRNPQPHHVDRAAARSVRGLPLTRRRIGDVVRYDLKPVAHPQRSLRMFAPYAPDG